MAAIGLLGWCPGRTSSAAEFHVTPGGHDTNPGDAAAPLRSIQAAASRAQPGDVITVHAGVYRERVSPPRGGDSGTRRIVYQAAPGERVEIRGSEVVTNWARIEGAVWKLTLPNAWFAEFNPFADRIRGDWFDPRGRSHHTGAVYIDGDWLIEAADLADVREPPGKVPLWFATVDATNTVIWAQFPGVDPTTGRVEIHKRRTVFYPDQPGRNFITVRGFILRQAATPWAPPTAEQVGLIGTHWSRGWIIESNVISHSTCSGIALGKYGDEWDNTSADTAEGYVKTIERALARGWSRESIGHHIVRDNTISHCEQAGIVGSLGAAFSTVTGNTIHDIHVRRLFSGAEMAGIKFHAAIDSVIRSNHIHHAVRGLWLDWMAQGTRVSGNLFHDNAAEDLFAEVNHGPFLVDHNLFLSAVSLLDMSEGGAYAHNLFAGRIISRPEPGRATPYHPAHSTTVAGLATIQGGDNRFFNNVFVGPAAASGNARPDSRDAHHAAGYGLWVYDDRQWPLQTAGNVYLAGARPSARELGGLSDPNLNPEWTVTVQGGSVTVRLRLGPAAAQLKTFMVTTARLGLAKVTQLPYVQADDSNLRLDTDLLGRRHRESNPAPGPFSDSGEQARSWRIR
jgi:alpha-N-arabinofuranosidase